MGYESKYYIVAKSNSGFGDEKGKRWAEKIAEFNMCKFVDLANFFKKETDCYIYADDGDTPIVEDRYGDSLKELSIEDALTALSKVEKEIDYYRRIKPFKALLTEFKEDADKWGYNLFILHYGY